MYPHPTHILDLAGGPEGQTLFSMPDPNGDFRLVLVDRHGQEIWHRDGYRSVLQAGLFNDVPALIDRAGTTYVPVYFGHEDEGSSLIAIDRSGREQWRTLFPWWLHNVSIDSDGHLLAINAEGLVHIDRASGQVVDRTALDDREDLHGGFPELRPTPWGVAVSTARGVLYYDEATDAETFFALSGKQLDRHDTDPATGRTTLLVDMDCDTHQPLRVVQYDRSGQLWQTTFPTTPGSCPSQQTYRTLSLLPGGRVAVNADFATGGSGATVLDPDGQVVWSTGTSLPQEEVDVRAATVGMANGNVVVAETSRGECLFAPCRDSISARVFSPDGHLVSHESRAPTAGGVLRQELVGITTNRTGLVSRVSEGGGDFRLVGTSLDGTDIPYIVSALSDLGGGSVAPQTHPDCPSGDLHVIGARGSGQQRDATEVGLPPIGHSMGMPVSQFVVELRTEMAGTDITYEGVTYPAVKAWIALGDALAWLAVHEEIRVHVYNHSVAAGAIALHDRVEWLADNCPGLRLVLTGFSQGADVVGDYLNASGQQVAEDGTLAAAYLFADPQMNPWDPVVTGTFRSRERIFSQNGLLGPRDPFPEAVALRLESICLDGDLICAFPPRAPTTLATHSGYATAPYYGLTVPEHAARRVAMMVGPGGFAQAAADGPRAALSVPSRVAPGSAFGVSTHESIGTGRTGIVSRDIYVDGITVATGDSPQVELVAPLDAGTMSIELRVVDAAGNVTTDTATVIVDPDAPRPPGPPTDVAVTPTIGGAWLSWTGNAPFHAVEGTDGSRLHVTPDDRTWVRATGERAVRIVAIDDIGTSSPTDPVVVSPLRTFGTTPTVRVGDDTVTGTAAALATAVWPAGADTVVIAREDAYADALAASAVAGQRDAPILYTASNELSPVTATAITELGATTALVMGGTAAVSDLVADTLVEMGLDVERIAGPNRYATAAAAVSTSGRAYVVEGAHASPDRGWPDAVSVAGLAATTGNPVLLVEHDRLPEETRLALLDNDITDVTIIGGTAAVSATIEDELADLGITTERLAGTTRYLTSLAVADRQIEESEPAHDMVFVSTGRDWPDALAAGPASARLSTTMFLVDGLDETGAADTITAIDDLDPAQAIITGGMSSITVSVENAIAEAVSGG